MSENKDMGMEKIELNDLLMEMVNEVLEEEGKGLGLQVEEVDVGIIVCPDSASEIIKSPEYKEEVKENVSLLVDMKVREVIMGLLNSVMIKLHINERREVCIKNYSIHEAEILESDLNASGMEIGEEKEKMLEEKSHQISEAVKAAIEQMMRRVVTLRKRM